MIEQEKLVQEVLLYHHEITARIKSMADEIAKDFKEQSAGEDNPELILLCVLYSAAVFAEHLQEQLLRRGVNVKIENVKASSYEGMESTGKPEITFHFNEKELAGKRVLVVEDMIDTGITLDALMQVLQELEPSSLHIAVLLKKIKEAVAQISAKYVGFEIPDLWVHGFGIDTDGFFRDLLDIMAVILRHEDREKLNVYGGQG